MNICVFGAASKTIDEKYIKPVEALGEYLAKNGHNLVFGAGSTGEMGAVSKGFKKGGGKIHGVVPEFFKEHLDSFVNWNCDEMTLTETMRERKAIMEDISDSFVITPGGSGTFEEFFEVLTLKQLGRHRKPIAIYNIDGYYDMLVNTIKYSIDTEFIKSNCEKLFKVF
ncbi:MAG TPA: TIGR00730 family Rossman fold protein, partial [Ruminococcaceae bacterium]|nr:TIGR00730 family Rossman fold protein [Oscillospiraceae bacterium]